MIQETEKQDTQQQIRQKLWADVVAANCDDKVGGTSSAVQAADHALREFDKRFAKDGQ